MIRKCDFFIKATLVCIKNGFFFTNKTKKPDTVVSGFVLLPLLEKVAILMR
jgi:hypothetical protein